MSLAAPRNFAHLASVTLLLLAVHPALAQPSFQLPTANRALLEPGGEERFFAATPGRDWHSGTFGCVRSDGWQLHEGLDIKSVTHDKKGEPTDPVLASADGTVAYLNRKAGLSNYGNYLVLCHRVEGIDIYTLYAHLREIAVRLKAGDSVKAGAEIGVLGRTSNTKQAITKDRAHVHFEINLKLNDRFSEWQERALSGQRNDHGNWNGQNLAGLDPRAILLQQRTDGANYSLLKFIRSQTPLCRVLVHKTDFPWLQHYRPLIKRNPVAEKEGIAGYEVALNFNAVPFQLIPRAASEIKGKEKYQLLAVNEEEHKKNPARRLVARKGDKWELTAHATQLLDLLTY